MPGCGGVVSDLGGFVARLACANGIDEVCEMQDRRLGLVGKFQIFCLGFDPRSLGFGAMVV